MEKNGKFEYYCDKMGALIQKMNSELEEKKRKVSEEGIDAVFKYAFEYIQQCDIISCMESISEFVDDEVEDLSNGVEIPIENIEYLLFDNVNAFEEIDKRFGWYLDSDMWQGFEASLICAIEKAYQDAK